MEAQLEYIAQWIHVVARLAPICMFSRCLLTKFLHRSSVGSLIRVCVVGWEGAPEQAVPAASMTLKKEPRSGLKVEERHFHYTCGAGTIFFLGSTFSLFSFCTRQRWVEIWVLTSLEVFSICLVSLIYSRPLLLSSSSSFPLLLKRKFLSSSPKKVSFAFSFSEVRRAKKKRSFGK